MGERGAEVRRAIFIDRDGVVVKAIKRDGFPLPTAPFSFSEFSLMERVEEALLLLKERGFLVIMVTNQPDLAYGHITLKEWKKIHSEVASLSFDDIFICFHTRGCGCERKKPKPGMLLNAQKIWNIDLGESYIVGDTDADMGAGKAVGCTRILVDAEYNKHVDADFRVGSLYEAAKLVTGLRCVILPPERKTEEYT